MTSLLPRALHGLFCLLLLLPSSLLASSQPERTLEFVENKGQWNPRARYMAELPSGRLFLEKTGFTYSFFDPEGLRAHHSHQASVPEKLRAHAYTVTFEGGKANPTLSGQDQTSMPRNYFLGADPKHWAHDVRGYREVRYTSVYPGIDVRLYENENQHLEYDFTVQPAGRPGAIRLRYRGADALSLNQGQLVIRTSVGSVTELAPKAWQTINGQRQPVSCAFALTGTVVSFTLGSYDPAYPLVIDPTVVFSSFTGSSADNWGFTATYDQQGNMYSGGIVFGSGYPASPGAYDTQFNASIDIGIIKYNTQVTGPAARLYATYLGGRETEAPHSLVVNPQGELLVLGSTSSNNFPTTQGAHDRSFHGGPNVQANGLSYSDGVDMFVAKLSATGNALNGSTFLGGNNSDGVSADGGNPLTHNYGDQFRGDITTDGAGNVYITSVTSSGDFPTPNGLYPNLRGNSDAVIAKFTPGLTALSWATYLGGSQFDAGYSIQLTSTDVYICGGTNSPNLPLTAGSYHTGIQGGTDGFVARLNTSGTALQRTTYIGTSSYDQTYFLQLDALSNVYLYGQTMGAYPVTSGIYSINGSRQFIHKLDPTLTTSIYSTTFGSPNSSNPNISPSAFLVDECERIYVAGWGGEVGNQEGNTFGMPVRNALQASTDGSDFYLAQFSPGMQGLEYATFFGDSNNNAGEHVDGGTSRFDKRGMVYQAVCGGCRGRQSGFPVPPGANTYNPRNGSSNCNNAAFKIDFSALFADPGPNRYICVDSGPVVLRGAPANGVWSGPGVVPLPGGGYQFVPTPALMGRNILTYTVNTTGTCVSVKQVRYTITPIVSGTFDPLPDMCLNSPALALSANPPGGTFSGPGVINNTFIPIQAGPSGGTYTLTYTLSDTVGCGSVKQNITVFTPPPIKAGNDTTLCAYETQSFILRNASPAGGTWSGTGVTPAGVFTPPNTGNKGGIYSLIYTCKQGPCTSTDVKQVLIAPSSAANVQLNVPECLALPQYTGLAPFMVEFVPVLPGGTYHWDFGDGITSTDATPQHVYAQAGTYYVRLTAQYANCDVLTQFAPVEVGEPFVPNIITPNGDTQNETFITRFSCAPAKLQVFTRWGNKVFETDQYRNDWRGDKLPDGVYYYYLKDTNGRVARGWIEIKRTPAAG